mgnify:CR=1 FL=1
MAEIVSMVSLIIIIIIIIMIELSLLMAFYVPGTYFILAED